MEENLQVLFQAEVNFFQSPPHPPTQKKKHTPKNHNKTTHKKKSQTNKTTKNQLPTPQTNAFREASV